MRQLIGIALLLGVLSSCTTVTPRNEIAEFPASSPVSTPTPLSTPTMPPTTVPGTGADMREVNAVVTQFVEAVVRNDEIVALLMLSPSAQKVVSASNLNVFLGRTERPGQIKVRSVRLENDLATADCTIQYAAGESVVQLRLVRLDGQWRIDGRVGD